MALRADDVVLECNIEILGRERILLSKAWLDMQKIYAGLVDARYPDVNAFIESCELFGVIIVTDSYFQRKGALEKWDAEQGRTKGEMGSSGKEPKLIGDDTVSIPRVQQAGVAYLKSTEPGEAYIGIYITDVWQAETFDVQIIKLLVHWAFEEVGFHRIYTALLEGSRKIPLMKVFSHVGFSHEGTRRKAQVGPDAVYKDVTYMGIVDMDWKIWTMHTSTPRTLWDRLFDKQQREREEILADDGDDEDRILGRKASTETLRANINEYTRLTGSTATSSVVDDSSLDVVTSSGIGLSGSECDEFDLPDSLAGDHESDSDMEAMHYYAGLPSSPRLLARTGTDLWEKPKGPEAYRKLKQLGVVVNHKLNTAWEDNVAPGVHACLDEMGVRWTSTDIVRIGVVGESSAPAILWIGVTPKSLAGKNAKTVAFRCLDVLKEFDIIDVHVEIRESSVTRFVGPKLLPPTLSSNPTVAVRHPLTHALGLPISAQATPYAAGTGGFFMAESGGNDKLLLITARHVVFPPDKEKNVKFERKNESQRRSNVMLLGEKAYESCLASIKARIREHEIIVEHWGRRLKAVEGQDDEDADAEREAAQSEIKVAEKAMEALYTFYNDVDTNWATHASRILGHVVCSPPIRLGAGTAAEQYTEDYAIIKVDDDKIDRTKFKGNVIDLGTKIPIWEFTQKMHPNLKNATSFKYPPNRLLPLRGIISDEEMRHPTLLDQNDEPCLMVIKDGSTTGVTIGRASGIMSHVREYFDDGSHETSKEWAILPYDTKSGAFSAPGDSGAVIVDGLGRVGGLLTGGSGVTPSSDITYATPITFLVKSIKANGYRNAHLNPA